MIEHTPDAKEGYAETLVGKPTPQLDDMLELLRSKLSTDPDQRLYDTQQMLAIAYELRRRHFRWPPCSVTPCPHNAVALAPQSHDRGVTIDRWVLICAIETQTWWDGGDWMGNFIWLSREVPE